jgi:hypothetical protein
MDPKVHLDVVADRKVPALEETQTSAIKPKNSHYTDYEAMAHYVTRRKYYTVTL